MLKISGKLEVNDWAIIEKMLEIYLEDIKQLLKIIEIILNKH